MNVWKVEFKKHFYFFTAFFILEIILDILTAFKLISFDGSTDTIYVFCQMISWILIVLYVIYNNYIYYVMGKDLMLNLLPWDKYKILIMKQVVLFTYMFGYFILQLIRYIIVLPNNLTKSKTMLFTTYMLSKVSSLFAFLGVIFLFMILAKIIINITNNKIFAAITFIILLILLIGVQGKLIYNKINANISVDFIIGIIDGMKGVNSYINIIPIIFVQKTGITFVESGFHDITIITNIIIGSLAYLLSLFLNKKIKFNYIEL